MKWMCNKGTLAVQKEVFYLCKIHVAIFRTMMPCNLVLDGNVAEENAAIFRVDEQKEGDHETNENRQYVICEFQLF